MGKRVAAARTEPRKKKRGGFRAFAGFCAAVVLLTLGCVVLVKQYVKPPAAGTLPDGESPTVPADDGESSGGDATDFLHEGEVPEVEGEGRRDDVFTMVVAGMDLDETRTDTILLVSMNAKTRELSVLSIPRDTRAYMADGRVHKINAAHNKGINRMKTELKNTVGFTVDRYLIVGYNAFIDLVDAIGGVEVDVPIDMYDEVDGDFTIDIKKGVQTLDGTDALGFVRFRSGYADADLGRIRAQQQFLSAAAKKMITPSTVLLIPKFLEILQNNVETDLTTGEMIWLGSAVLGMDSEDVRFDMLPGRAVGADYEANYEETLALVNAHYNPYVNAIKRLRLP